MAEPLRVALMLQIELLYKHQAEVFAGVHRYAEARGWETIVDDWVDETLLDKRSKSKPYDGIIARVEAGREKVVDLAARRGIPLVNVHRSSPMFDRVPGVFPDYEAVGRLRAEHLMSRGLRRFAYLYLENSVADRRMADGFHSALQDMGEHATEHTIPAGSGDSREGYLDLLNKLDSWIEGWQYPIGLAMGADLFARQMCNRLNYHGVRVPQEVVIVGGINEEHHCERPRPTITSIEVGYERVGYEAAKMLDGMMSQAKQKSRAKAARKRVEPQAMPFHVLLPPVGVMVRESSDFYAIDDKVVVEAMTFIAEHCHTPLTVNDIADVVGVSKKTLQNRFKQVLGHAVAQEVRRLRLERAKRELVDSDQPIESIATRAGFASRTHLYDVFRREIGITPRAYREQRRLEANP